MPSRSLYSVKVFAFCGASVTASTILPWFLSRRDLRNSPTILPILKSIKFPLITMYVLHRDPQTSKQTLYSFVFIRKVFLNLFRNRSGTR